MRARPLIIALAAALALAFAGAASAQPASDPKAMASKLGEEALSLHSQGRFADAFAKFETAEKIAHSPVLVLWMARSKRALGELAIAKRLYEQVARETLPADASAKWTAAKEDAARELEALVARIPRVVVSLRGAGPEATLEIDGAAARAGEPMPLDPGDHTIRASSGGAERTKKVHLDEGAPPLAVELRFDERAAPPARRGPIWIGASLTTVGAVGLVAGAITGGYALVLAGEIKEGCVGSQCLSSDEDKAHDADVLARASTGCLIAGGALAVAGVVLLAVRPALGAGTAASLELSPSGFRATIGF